jgi:diguanylate cyclase (GGDEF)-like protein
MTTQRSPSPLQRCGIPAAHPRNEAQRLAALKQYDLLDTAPEQSFDDLTALAAMACDTPIALISLIDADRQWFKGRIGFAEEQTARDLAFCAHTILRPDSVMEIGDASQDPRFASNPLVTGPNPMRFYAGAPLVTSDGLAIGTVCVMDQHVRHLSDRQRHALQALSRQVMAQMELRRTVARLELQSATDGLTGIWNRFVFDRRLREEWARHTRSKTSMGLLMLDVDHFKSFNDSHGHPAGDQALIQTTRAIEPILRGSDFFARYGGEEFAIVLPDTHAEGALWVGARIRSQLADTAWPLRPITASMGVAVAVPDATLDPNTLTARADYALYRAKTQGRDRVELFEDWGLA